MLTDPPPKSYKVHIYAQAAGPNGDNFVSFSLDSQVTNGVVLTYPGASPSPYAGFFASSAGGNVTSFLTKEGRQVYTNLPVIIEEE